MSTIPKRLGKYELQQQLGRGSVGEIWKAHDLQQHQDVAVKILYTDFQSDPNFLNRFAKEGQAIVSLHHSNIVQIREVNVTRPANSNETTAYIAMDYQEGQTLADYIHATSHQGNFPSIAQIVYLFTTLGVAIDHAHQQGIVHGNIKPGNILLNRSNTSKLEAGEPMLTDFGLAQLLGGAGNIASPAYMSPEQAKGQVATNRSDIYALGIILYEICTGVQPFRDESSVAVMMQQINTLPTPPILINANIPPALSEVILRAIAKDTATRFALASLLATAIADACSMQPNIHGASNRAAFDEEEASYHTRTGASIPILGVSQPLPKLSQPRLSSLSQPLPQVSGPLPALQNQSRYVTHMNNTSPSMAAASTNNRMLVTQPTRMPVPYQPEQFSPSLQPPAPPLIPPMPIARPKGWLNFSDVPVYIVMAVLLLLLLIIGSAIGINLLSNKGQATNGATAMTGHVFFQDDALGRDDVLRVEMQNVAPPPDGKSYFAWLHDITNHTLPLGQFTLQNNSIIFLYPGNAQHTNLLSTINGFTITTENTGSKPQAPTGQVVYRAMDNPTTFQYIKNILYQTPDLPGQQGAVAGLFDTIKSMNDKSNSIVDTLQGSHDYLFVTRQAIRIIEMIDGTNYARSSGDLPANDPDLINANIGLISSPTQIGYIDALAAQLTKLKQAAGNDAGLLQRIQHVENAITDLRDWIQKIRTYDIQLLQAPNFVNPTAINATLQLKNLASDAYTGHTIPPNPGPLPILGSAGAYQAYVEAQYMAAFTIAPA